ncbi:MAG: HeH/LEM domain-containing protein [Lactobacillaceae bacterium]|jgi:hypothetical protein|nr:HeH/LEM domain-containing protein [Lactobacillaceae bacterium]
MSKYRVLYDFDGILENKKFKANTTVEFEDARALEIKNVLPGFIDKIEEPEISKSSTVAEIKAHLDEQEIEYDNGAKKAELLDLI